MHPDGWMLQDLPLVLPVLTPHTDCHSLSCPARTLGVANFSEDNQSLRFSGCLPARPRPTPEHLLLRPWAWRTMDAFVPLGEDRFRYQAFAAWSLVPCRAPVLPPGSHCPPRCPSVPSACLAARGLSPSLALARSPSSAAARGSPLPCLRCCSSGLADVLQISSYRGCLCFLPSAPSHDSLSFLLHHSTDVLFSALPLKTKGVWWCGVCFFPMKNASRFFGFAIVFKNLKEACVKKHG